MSADKLTRLRRVLAHQEQIAAQNTARAKQNEAGMRAFFDFVMHELCEPDAMLGGLAASARKSPRKVTR